LKKFAKERKSEFSPAAGLHYPLAALGSGRQRLGAIRGCFGRGAGNDRQVVWKDECR
jgi:hypothetical protein